MLFAGGRLFSFSFTFKEMFLETEESLRREEAESSPSGLTPQSLFSLSRNRVFHSIDEAVQCGGCAFNIKMLILPGPAFC